MKNWWRPCDEKLVLTNDGLKLVFKDGSSEELLWSDVDRINVFKEDLLTTDLLCMELLSDQQNPDLRYQRGGGAVLGRG
jgi:hypothetical protein